VVLPLQGAQQEDDGGAVKLLGAHRVVVPLEGHQVLLAGIRVEQALRVALVHEGVFRRMAWHEHTGLLGLSVGEYFIVWKGFKLQDPPPSADGTDLPVREAEAPPLNKSDGTSKMGGKTILFFAVRTHCNSARIWASA